MIRTLAVLLALANPAAAQGLPPCVYEAIETRSAAFLTYNSSLREVFIAHDPDVAEIAQAAEDTQRAMPAATVARVTFLLESDPGLLADHPTLNQVMNLHADETALALLRSLDPDYAALEAARDTAIARTQNDPTMGALRATAQAVVGTPAFQTATDTFAAKNQAASESLQVCLE